jgi:hypothetical protein
LLLSNSGDGRVDKKKFGSYSVVLSQSFEDGLGKIIITHGKDKVFESSEIDDHYYFGNHFDDDEEKDLYSGRDITGKGIPNLVVSSWTGGAHCCHFLHIFELGKKLKKLVTVKANSSSVRLVDLDHDGYPEIEFWDGSIDYLFASFAGSPGGRVVLKFKNNQYEVAPSLMRKASLNQKQIEKLKMMIVASFKKEKSPELPYDFLSSMMYLSYSGQFDLAMKIASETWPADRLSFLIFQNKFTQALRHSLYWKSF